MVSRFAAATIVFLALSPPGMAQQYNFSAPMYVPQQQLYIGPVAASTPDMTLSLPPQLLEAYKERTQRPRSTVTEPPLNDNNLSAPYAVGSQINGPISIETLIQTAGLQPNEACTVDEFGRLYCQLLSTTDQSQLALAKW